MFKILSKCTGQIYNSFLNDTQKKPTESADAKDSF